MIVLDTSIVVAFMDRRDAKHAPVRDWMQVREEELSTTPLVVAEIDHLVARQGGAKAAHALREDLDRGVYPVEWWPSALRETVAVAERYEGMELGLTDASLVALADHLQTTAVATLDESHFRALKPLSGGDTFKLLPADAE